MAANNNDSIIDLREQILENANVAFGILYEDDSTQTELELIVIMRVRSYQARIVYGLRNESHSKVFMQALWAETLHGAYEHLLQASCKLLDELTTEGRISEIDDSTGKPLPEGFYDAKPGHSREEA